MGVSEVNDFRLYGRFLWCNNTPIVFIFKAKERRYMENSEYLKYLNKWKRFFICKGFSIKWKDENFISLIGLSPLIRVEIYAGNFRTDTNSGGCICADLEKQYNKVSQCPIYHDLTVDEEEFYNEILKLVRP